MLVHPPQKAKKNGYLWFELQLSSLLSQIVVDEEEATSYEIGGKFSLLDGSMKLNVATFYTEFDDMHINQ